MPKVSRKKGLKWKQGLGSSLSFSLSILLICKLFQNYFIFQKHWNQISWGGDHESKSKPWKTYFTCSDSEHKSKNQKCGRHKKNVKGSIFQILEAYFLPNTTAVVTLDADSVKNLGSIS